jgi:serine/threonine-protein kinase Chk1
VLKGEIRIETLAAAVSAGPNAPKCLVFMRRSKGNPLEWRRLFRSLAGDVQRQISQRLG